MTINMSVSEVLQMAVDYYTLDVNVFESKYPVRPPDKECPHGFIIPCWVELAREALAETGVEPCNGTPGGPQAHEQGSIPSSDGSESGSIRARWAFRS